MSDLDKIRQLAASANFDVSDDQARALQASCGANAPPARQLPVSDKLLQKHLLWENYMVKRAGGGCSPLLKVLYTNYCEKNCQYCCNRNRANVARTSFTPEELARSFMQLSQKGVTRGLFLSSGIHHNPVQTQDRMIETVEILRRRYHYDGYIHLKLLPGADGSQVEQSVRLANRVSVNLEAPHRRALAVIAPEKDMMGEIVSLMTQLHQLAQRGIKPALGYTTQLVVGAAGESDVEILTTISYLYDRLGLTQAYYSGFNPVPGSPLDQTPPASPLRAHRLYQADFLIRKYGFKQRDLSFSQQGNLQLDKNPKLIWAEQHPERFPIEINTAPIETLILVPGLGPRGAARIAAWRRQSVIHSPQQLRRSGLRLGPALPFLLFNGKLLTAGTPGQLSLF